MPTRNIAKIPISRQEVQNLQNAAGFVFDTESSRIVYRKADGTIGTLTGSDESGLLSNKRLDSTCDISAATGVGGKSIAEGGGLPASQGAGFVLADNGITQDWSDAPEVTQVGVQDLIVRRFGNGQPILPVYTRKLVFTDTEIKALPTLQHIEMVPAITDVLLTPVWGILIGHFTAGYTADASEAWIGFETVGGAGYGTAYIENVASPVLKDRNKLSTFLATGDHYTRLVMFADDAIDPNSGNPLSNDTLGVVEDYANVVGSIVLTVHNASNAAFTGGAAGNTLTAIVGYHAIQL